jgi:hypothetical protein
VKEIDPEVVENCSNKPWKFGKPYAEQSIFAIDWRIDRHCNQKKSRFGKLKLAHSLFVLNLSICKSRR